MSNDAPAAKGNDTNDRPYRAEFHVQGDWCSAAVRFEMPSDAIDHARDKYAVWIQPDAWRVVDTRSLTVVNP